MSPLQFGNSWVTYALLYMTKRHDAEEVKSGELKITEHNFIFRFSCKPYEGAQTKMQLKSSKLWCQRACRTHLCDKKIFKKAS